MRTWIERMPVSIYFGPTDVNSQVKAMKRRGWDMAVLLAPGEKEVVILGFFHGLGEGKRRPRE
jgi:hypothetical protein